MDITISATTIQTTAAVAQVVAAVALIVTAVIMLRSTRAAERSAEATEENLRGQLLATLLEEFGSREYLDAARVLADWPGPEGGSGGEPNPTLDHARRIVKSYFRKVYHLHREGYLSKSDLRECVAGRYATELFLRKAEQVGREKRADYNRYLYDFFDDFHDRQLDRPLRHYTPPSDGKEGTDV